LVSVVALSEVRSMAIVAPTIPADVFASVTRPLTLPFCTGGGRFTRAAWRDDESSTSTPASSSISVSAAVTVICVALRWTRLSALMTSRLYTKCQPCLAGDFRQGFS